MEGGKVVEQGSVLEVFKNPQQPITKRFVQQMTEPEETRETIQHLLEQISIRSSHSAFIYWRSNRAAINHQFNSKF